MLTSIMTKMNSKWIFLKKFIQNPREVGSVIPSSNSLTQKMMEPIPWNNVRSLVELGAGTGVFTRAIDRLVPPGCQVALFEKETEMRELLEQKYSRFHVFPNALELTDSINSIGLSRVDCIVSGLPFANFPQEKRLSIIQQVHDSLSEDGMFITFQYSLQMKQILESSFKDVRIAFVPWNIPPAFVYICRK